MADPEHVEVVMRGAAAIAAHVYRREIAGALRERVPSSHGAKFSVSAFLMPRQNRPMVDKSKAPTSY